MIVFRCPDCGRIYREKPEKEKCYECGIYLSVVVQEDTFGGSDATSEPEVQKSEAQEPDPVSSIATKEADKDGQEGHFHTPLNIYGSRRLNTQQQRKKEEAVPSKNADDTTTAEEKNYIEGKVVSATRDDNFKRLPWIKLADKYLYRLRVSDIQNTVCIRGYYEDGNIFNKSIIMYGNIKGGIEVIRTGMNVKAYGKENNRDEFMAYKMICNDSFTVKIGNEISDYIYLGLPLWIVLGVFAASWFSIIVPFIFIFCICMYLSRGKGRRPLFNRIKISIIISVVVELLWLVLRRGH